MSEEVADYDLQNSRRYPQEHEQRIEHAFSLSRLRR